MHLADTQRRVGIEEELKRMRHLAVETADEVLSESGVVVDYTVGTMIELPRACIIADEIAKHADFFSFGTSAATLLLEPLVSLARAVKYERRHADARSASPWRRFLQIRFRYQLSSGRRAFEGS